MDLNKVFEDETLRAMGILGGVGTVKRDVSDRVEITIPAEEWRKMFNIAEGYAPAKPDWSKITAPIHVRFVRVHMEEKKGV